MDDMQNHSTGGIEIGLRGSSDIGQPASTTALDVTQLLYFLLLIPALFVAQMPLGIYPPLDTRLPMGLIICSFLLSAIPRLMNIKQRPVSDNVQWWKVVSTVAGLLLPLIGIMVFLNGKLDTSPRGEVRTAVIRKIAPAGYRRAQYIVVVSSWRPGRSEEVLNVNSRVFERARVGRAITIEMRQGRFGLPWVANVAPE
jgi:hypothetical protein